MNPLLGPQTPQPAFDTTDHAHQMGKEQPLVTAMMCSGLGYTPRPGSLLSCALTGVWVQLMPPGKTAASPSRDPPYRIANHSLSHLPKKENPPYRR